tara:strand:+ start:1153 stop:1404 length:252 start_codon:yes stop_codon:yes gene_type:complete
MYVNARKILKNRDTLSVRINNKFIREFTKETHPTSIDEFEELQWKFDLEEKYDGLIYLITFSNGDCHEYIVQSKYVNDLFDET